MEEVINNEAVTENEQVSSDPDLDRQELEQDMEQQIEQRAQERVEEILKQRENKDTLISELKKENLPEELFELLNLDSSDIDKSMAKLKKCASLLRARSFVGTGHAIVGRRISPSPAFSFDSVIKR